MYLLLDLASVKFVVGYVVVLAVPGPNMLAIGGLAALRGFRATVPVCVGVSAGATVLAALVFGAVTTTLQQAWQPLIHMIGSGLLVLVAFSIIRMRVAAGRPPSLGRGGAIEFGAGFCTAAANPITGAYFAAYFAAALDEPGQGSLALLLVPETALFVSLGVAASLARPRIRRAAVRWHRTLRLITAGVLILAALNLLVTAFV